MGFLRGQPDWSHAQARTFTGAGESDLEQSARRWWPLGSMVTGEVHFIDDFEAANLHWLVTGAGAPAGSVLDTLNANSGEQSVRMTTSATLNTSTNINRFLDMPFDTNLGITCWVRPPANVAMFGIKTTVYQNLRHQDYIVWFDFTNSKITMFTGGATVDQVNPANFAGAVAGFHMYQLLIDANAKTYRGVRWGTQEFLTTIPSGNDVVGAQADQLTVTLTLFNNSGTAGTAWVDDCIVTRKQP